MRADGCHDDNDVVSVRMNMLMSFNLYALPKYSLEYILPGCSISFSSSLSLPCSNIRPI